MWHSIGTAVRFQVATASPSAAPSGEAAADGNDAEDGVDTGGAFGEFFSLEDVVEESPAKGAAAAGGADESAAVMVAAADDSSEGKLPWARASRRICSPLLRLHNGDNSMPAGSQRLPAWMLMLFGTIALCFGVCGVLLEPTAYLRYVSDGTWSWLRRDRGVLPLFGANS